VDDIDKKELSEIDICDLFITPSIKDAGWDQPTQIRREVTLTPGPVIVRGNMSARNKKKKKFADYVLSWKPGIPLAVVEAKDNTHSVSHGMQQGLGYSEILQVPSTFSSNGDAFASHNKVPAAGEDIETQLTVQARLAVNVSLTVRNWLIGCHIAEFELHGADRARYGKNLLGELARELGNHDVSNCGRRQLYGYLSFYRTYPQIVRAVTAQFRSLLPVRTAGQRDYRTFSKTATA